MDKELVEYAWANFCKFIFPRELGIDYGEHFSRVNVSDIRELCSYAWQNLNKNLYVSVYSESMLKDNYINCIFLDLDNDTLDEPYYDMMKIVTMLESNYGYVPQVLFSGKKGFHIHIGMNPIKLQNIRMTLRRFYKNMFMDIETLDPSVIGDKRRVSRLPYTINQGSGRYCVPIEVGWSLDRIIQESENPDVTNGIRLLARNDVCEEIGGLLGDLDKTTPIYEQTNRPVRITEEKIKQYREEIDIFISTAGDIDNGRHRWLHFMFVPRLCMMGKSDDEIYDMARRFVNATSPNGNRGWGHYEPHVRISIDRTKEGNWMPWKINTFFEYYPDLAPK